MLVNQRLRLILIICLIIISQIFSKNLTAKLLADNFHIQIIKKDNIIKRLKKYNGLVNNIKSLPENEQEQVICLALNIYNETRSSTTDDKIASSYTVINRLFSNNYPRYFNQNSICNVIFDPKQYSWTNNKHISFPKESRAWQESQYIAYTILYNDSFIDNAKTFTFMHYMTKQAFKNSFKYKYHWAKHKKYKEHIGSHVYLILYNDIEDKVVFSNIISQLLLKDSILVEQKLKDYLEPQVAYKSKYNFSFSFISEAVAEIIKPKPSKNWLNP